MKKKKLDDLIQNETVERCQLFHPILMHFAANYIGKTYAEFAQDQNVLVEANLRCLEDFDLDYVNIISDPVREVSAFGGEVVYPTEPPPYIKKPFIKTIDDVIALKNPDVYNSARTKDRIKAAGVLSEKLNGQVPVCGWVEGPLAEACDVAGVSEILLKLTSDPEFVVRLMENV